MKGNLCAGLAAMLVITSTTLAYGSETTEQAMSTYQAADSAVQTQVMAVQTMQTTEPGVQTTEQAVSKENEQEKNQSKNTTSTSAITQNFNYSLDFTGKEMKLSLKQAKELMTASSSGIETARVNLAGDRAKTETYYRTISNINRLDNTYNDLGNALNNMASQIQWIVNNSGGKVSLPVVQAQVSYMSAAQQYNSVSTPSKSQRAMARLAATFAKEQSDRNFEAAKNSILSETIKMYFQTLQAKDALRIYQDNVAVQETILKNTKIQKEVGTLAKQDVLSAEVALEQAKLDCADMEKTYALARMALNQYFGFDVMQDVTLTDSLSDVTASSISLDQAVKDARANRNEIIAAVFMENLKALNFTDAGNQYSADSPEYYQAKADLMSAQKTEKDTPVLIEMDVKSKYMSMKNAQKAVEVSRVNIDKAKETLRLAQLTYNAGMLGLTDMQMAQLGAFKAELEYSQNLLTYQLAVIDYEQSTTVGTYRVAL